MFSVKTIGTGATTGPAFSSDHTPSLSSADAAAGLTSLSALQSLAASGAKFNTKDIMSIAAAKQAVKFGLNHGPTSSSVDTTGVGTLQELTEAVSSSGSNGAENKVLAPNAEDWANLVTIGHVEVIYGCALLSLLTSSNMIATNCCLLSPLLRFYLYTFCLGPIECCVIFGSCTGNRRLVNCLGDHLLQGILHLLCLFCLLLLIAHCIIFD